MRSASVHGIEGQSATLDRMSSDMHGSRPPDTSPFATHARSEVLRYCAWPTHAASYLTGCLEIERMRHRWMSERRGDLRSFHDTIADTGGLPIAVAERATFG